MAGGRTTRYPSPDAATGRTGRTGIGGAVKGLGIGCGAVALLVLAAVIGIGTLASKEWRFARSTVIQAPPELIHANLADLRRWPKRGGQGWSGWIQDANPAGPFAFDGGPGAGMGMSWTSEGGHACVLTLTSSDPAAGVEYELAIRDFPSTAFGSFAFQPAPAGATTVTWTTWGERSDGLGGLFARLMEPMLAKTYEDDLDLLRQQVEAQRQQLETQRARKEAEAQR
jgi:hypothetical protein